jgi:hypothetical protein
MPASAVAQLASALSPPEVESLPSTPVFDTDG